MGTHPKGPSTIAAPDQYSGQSLRHWLAANPWALGCDVETTFHGDLPFLFKVLSIKKPLSIQAHPTKEHAKELHALLPDKYPDNNHKPEMAIALTTFEAFCGFRPISEIILYLHRVPEFRCVVGEDAAMELIALERIKTDTSSSEAKEALKKCFSSFMHQEDDIISQQLANLVAKAEKLKFEGEVVFLYCIPTVYIHVVCIFVWQSLHMSSCRTAILARCDVNAVFTQFEVCL